MILNVLQMIVIFFCARLLSEATTLHFQGQTDVTICFSPEPVYKFSYYQINNTKLPTFLLQR